MFHLESLEVLDRLVEESNQAARQGFRRAWQMYFSVLQEYLELRLEFHLVWYVVLRL